MRDSSELYLIHHGVKGQRWGVRRYQNEDGSLKQAGKKKQKSQADIIRGQKITRNLLIGAGAVALTSAVVIVGVKHGREYLDSSIKAGQIIGRIEKDGSGQLHDAFYAAINKGDRAKYKSLYGNQIFTQTKNDDPTSTPEIFDMEFSLKKGIKVAGGKTGRKTFEQLRKNDSEFSKMVDEVARQQLNRAPRNNREAYEAFIAINPNSWDKIHETVGGSGEAYGSRFLNALKKQGYGGLKDMHDMGKAKANGLRSGYYAKKPVIFIGQKDNVQNLKVKKLNYRKDILGGYDKQIMKVGLADPLINDVLPVGMSYAGIGLGSAGMIYGSVSSKKVNAKVKKLKKEGKSNKDISEQLGISEKAVQNHLKTK